MQHSHGGHVVNSRRGVSKSHGAKDITSNLAKGAAMSAGAQTGKTIMSNLKKHPILLVGIGIVAGYCIHKYRKEIIESVSSVTDKGKDFVLHQKENLEDIVAEAKETKD